MTALALLSERDVTDPPETLPPVAMGEEVDDPLWLGGVAERLISFLALEPGWDSYGAAVPRPEAIEAALGLLFQLLNPTMPEPQVVPLASGGVQLEWYEPDVELEIRVHSAFKVDVCYESGRTGEVVEMEGMTDLSPLRSWIDQLTG